jgi:trimeric autotransporter adhesin
MEGVIFNMANKRVFKLATASAVAASALVAAVPASAASVTYEQAEKQVNLAREAANVLHAAYTKGADYENRVVAEYDEARRHLIWAEQRVNGLKDAKQKSYLNSRLDGLRATIERTNDYNNAVRAADFLEDAREVVVAEMSKGFSDLDAAKAAQADLAAKEKLAKTNFAKVYGAEMQKNFTEMYITADHKALQTNTYYGVALASYLVEADKAIKANDVATAEKFLGYAEGAAGKLTNEDLKADLTAEWTELKSDLEAIKVAKVESVSAINGTQAVVTFNKEITEATPAHFTVVRKDDVNIRAFVTKAEIGANKKEVKLTFASKLDADKSYEVVANGVKAGEEKVENSKAEFTYVKSVVTKVEFTSTSLAPTKNVKDIIKVTDQLGRDITSEVEFDITSSDSAIVDPTGLTADKGSDSVADTAIVKVTVKGTSVATPNTIVTVSGAAPATFVGFHIGATETAKTTADYRAKKAEDIVTSVSMGDSSKYLNAYYVDQYGKDVDAKVGSGEATYTNLTPGILVVGADGKITPISEGTGAVKVKVGTVETTLNIVVKAAALPTTLTVDKANVNAAVGAVSETFKVAFKDQYGKDVNFASGKLSIKSADETIAKATTAAAGTVSDVTYTVQAIKEGSTSFTVTYTDGSTKYEKVIPVTITKAGSLASYKVEVDHNALDKNAAVTASTEDSAVATFSVYTLDANGNKLQKLSAANTTLSFVDETATNAVKSKLSLADGTDTLTVTNALDSATTAQVAVKVGSLVVDTITFNLKDTTAVASKAVFENNALPTLAVGDTLETEVLSLVKAYDQFNVLSNATLDIPSDGLVVTNTTNGFDATSTVAVTDATKDATADVVITKIVENGKTTNLLSSPVVIKAVVKAPVSVGHATVSFTDADRSVTTLGLNQALTEVKLTAGSDAITFTKSGTWSPDSAYTADTDPAGDTPEVTALKAAGYTVYTHGTTGDKLVAKYEANAIKLAWTNGLTVAELNSDFAKTFAISAK